MAKLNVNAYFQQADAVRIITEGGKSFKVIRPGWRPMLGAGLIVLRINKAGKRQALTFFDKFVSRDDWRKKMLTVEMSIHYKRRSLDQNALLWALIKILALEAYGEYGHKERLYEALLLKYAPRVVDKVTGERVPLRSSLMNTIQFSRLVDGVMYELAQQDISFTDTSEIKDYWFRWNEYKYAGGMFPLSEAYQTAKNYRAAVNYCEACMCGLRYDASRGAYDGQVGHMAHIVSKGAGGSDELENLMHLCERDHIQIQHQNGWSALIEMYPHLERRVNLARERAGLGPVDKLAMPDMI